MRKWRKMTWAIIAWCVLIFAWMIAGGISASDTSDCATEPTAQLRQLCEDATAAGTGIGVALIGLLGFLGFVVLSLIWFMTRPRGRECPACGQLVKRGMTKCPECGHDFAQAPNATGRRLAEEPTLERSETVRGRGLGVRKLGIVAAVLAGWALAIPAYAQDPATLESDLSAAQGEVDSIAAELADAEQRLRSAHREAKPDVLAATSAARRAAAAEHKVAELASELEEKRSDAADEVDELESNYAAAKDDRNSAIAMGLGSLAIAAVLVAAFLLLRRFLDWTPTRWQGIGSWIVVAVFALGGAGLILGAPTAEEPDISTETRQLAEAADEDPLETPTTELESAMRTAESLNEKAERLASRRDDALTPVRSINTELSSLKSDLEDARERADEISQELARAKAKAAEEAEFRAAAVTIDYDQLIKNPDEYKDTKVVYEGQIFQIQEAFGQSIILLSVTDEGYGFWTDEIWVDAGEIASAEDDIITVYGTVTGTKTYETQIGGSRYVPQVKAKYIDE